MSTKPSPPPPFIKILGNLVGLGMIVHETLLRDTPRWPILFVGVVLIGLVGPDIIERMFPDRSDYPMLPQGKRKDSQSAGRDE